MATITTADVRAYIAHRQAAGIVATRGERKGERIGDVSNAEINRELTVLKRMFTLAVQAEKILRRPHIPLLEERNTRTGFFELEQLESRPAHFRRRSGRSWSSPTSPAGESRPKCCRSNGARWTSRPARSGSIRRRRRTATAACSR